ncbi:hypothetical protein B0H34DRAFT_794627 [Crassisporium funariophilum]|nr:hypothetical protein B0H34DRAFT_794627 [Crassisporium funariophilum]
MSVSAADAFAAIKFIHTVVTKVKDNREEIHRLAGRLEYILLSLEDSRECDVLQAEEYNDALTVLFNLIERSQRLLQRLLKRSLGDRTWNRDEIATEINRINLDVQNFMSVHTVSSAPHLMDACLSALNPFEIRTLDSIQAESTKQLTSLSSNVHEIMVKLAEIDIRIGTPPGAPWSSDLLVEAKQCIASVQSSNPSQIKTISPSPEPDVMTAMAIATAGRSTLRISDVRRDANGPPEIITLDDIKVGATFNEILGAIQDAGYEIPWNLQEEPLVISVSSTTDKYDTTAPGGLQISQSTPLLHWWNKFTAHHGLSPATTPSHNIARLSTDEKTVTAGEVEFLFHRTLRVPDTNKVNKLPPSLGQFHLQPVSKYAYNLPDSIVTKGGFIMPMFQREALWVAFKAKRDKPAVKVSVGGVNAISGVAKNMPSPPDSDQDYVVAGLQPWLDGIMTEEGIVRQFVAMPLGKGYTVEEQVTGKTENSSFQFDIFPQREKPPGNFIHYTMPPNTYKQQRQYESAPKLTSHMTPGELLLPEGAKIGMRTFDGIRPQGKTWTLSAYRCQIDAQAGLKAFYSTIIHRGGRPLRMLGGNNETQWSISRMMTGPLDGRLGLGAGGKIVQRIYKDPASSRMYDEEAGHRFHVHIVTTDAWEEITGIVPEKCPISLDTYKTHNMPWYTLYDEHLPALAAASTALQDIKSVSQIDIDPYRAECSQHSNSSATCVFRPCSHLACKLCLDQTLNSNSVCCQCRMSVDKFVGLGAPIKESYGDQARNPEASMSGQRRLPNRRVDLGAVTIYHLPEDRVSPLFLR